MQKIKKIGFNISFIFYLLALIVILFLGSLRGNVYTDLTLYEYIKSSSNFIPFKTITSYVSAIFDGTMNMNIPIKNLVGNLLLFLPMGIYLPYFIRSLNRVSMFTVSMIVLLLTIELIQLLTRRGSFDIDDLILNMIGAFIGYSLSSTGIIGESLKRTQHAFSAKS
ncbi:VanZ family protein [Bacillus salacetis]|uniref:VanZ family protein n=1 Tax=Bacillus salacetis TaxID=2315464 RepID=A0A3A1QXS4_9BACI|nr:VanZ family protein [Bacillus salacetis]RIW30740.1 VanZ family protein [Bacillus salacetis]